MIALPSIAFLLVSLVQSLNLRRRPGQKLIAVCRQQSPAERRVTPAVRPVD